MSFFFVDESLTVGNPTEISGDAAHHIGTVRRIKKGEEIQLQDPSGSRVVARVDDVSKRALTVMPLRLSDMPAAPQRALTLLQAYIAEQKLDLVLQKATELGAARIIIWQADHSPHEMTSDRVAHKRERFMAIMRNACEQSGRPDVPALEFAGSLESGLALLSGETPVFLDAGGSADTPPGPLALIVGPEGGFSDAEYEIRTSRDFPTVSIGTYTLRAETAAIAVLGKLA
jgi:16S rRNA (uracil1498-N3)-methyltransferase